MKIVNQGSLLIELLIYISLFAFLGAISFSWFSRSQRQLLLTAQSSNQLMRLYSALDLLVRDLRISSRNANGWLMTDSQNIIWRTPKADIGWYVDNHTLYRVEGSFNEGAMRWNKKKRSVAIQNLESVYFGASQEGGLIKKIDIIVAVKLGNETHTVQETIYPEQINL